MSFYLLGPIGRAIILVLAIVGFVLALGDVLDAYDAYWKFTVPLTAVYAGLIWRLALAPAEGEFVPKGGWALVFYLVLKTGMTIALLLVTLGVIALGYDIYLLVMHNWHYIVVALAILALIVGWAMLPERKDRPTRRRAKVPTVNDPPAAPGADDRAS